MQKKISIVNKLAAQIRSRNNSNRSESMRQAWALVNGDGAVSLLTFRKLSGEVTTRVVSQNWTAYQAPVGGASNRKEGQVIFADMAKVATGEKCIISTYADRIICN